MIENDRYARQKRLAEIGEEGQEKLRKARVLIVGAGGLGSPVALYLTGAGIGTLGIIDDDRVSLSNLQRQILYTDQEVGQPKVECARQCLKRHNHEVCIRPYPCKLTADNAREIIGEYDLVVDGCDNYPTRYIISDACASLGIPYIYGAIGAFAGQVAVLCHPQGRCTYRHLYPEEERDDTPDPAPGVVGTTPGMVGIAEANEALKLVAGYGSPLIDKLWTINLLDMRTNIISL